MNERRVNKDSNNDKSGWNSYIRYSAMGFQMIVIIGLFTFAGYMIDEKSRSKTPLFTALLSVLGVVIALYVVIRSIKNIKS